MLLICASADVSTLLAVVQRQTAAAFAAFLSRDLARIQEWCNHWCMTLNPNETRASLLVDPGQ